MGSPIIDSFQTSKAKSDQIILITKRSIKENDNLFNVCKNIKEKTDPEFESHWTCNTFYDNVGLNYFNQNPKFSVHMKFDKLSVNVERVEDWVSFTFSNIDLRIHN